MNTVIVQFWCLFIATLTLQLVAISIRNVFVSLFFSFLHSICISVILFAMGSLWIALAHLWFSTGICYFSLIQTTILLGAQKMKRFRRRITVSLFIYIIAVTLLFYMTAQLFTTFDKLEHHTGTLSDSSVLTTLSTDHGLAILTLALFTLSSLISVFLLVRREDGIAKRNY